MPLCFVFFADFVDDPVCQAVQHAVGCAGANDKIIGKHGDFLQIEQQDVFPFFFFKGINNGVGKFERI